MPYEMTFTDEYGTVYPESYWKVAQTNMCQAERSGMIAIYGYQDEANVGKRIIGQKSYNINTEAYDEYFAPNVLNPEGENPVRAGYIYALATKDVGTGEDAVSFFEDAVEV
jgi:hypothetical protein